MVKRINKLALYSCDIYFACDHSLTGFARVAGESRRDLPAVSWVLPQGLSARALGGVFTLDWISK